MSEHDPKCPERVWIWFNVNGGIRSWATVPFEDGQEYRAARAAPEVDPKAVIDIINVVTDLADADALDKAIPEVSRRIAELHVRARSARAARAGDSPAAPESLTTISEAEEWVDPDDAPELPPEWFVRAAAFKGERLIRGADDKALLPCPFCGGEASLGNGREGFFVNCVECLASTNVLTPAGNSEADAIAAWNGRLTTPTKGPYNG